MTSSLQDAFKKASALPEDQQNALAAVLLDEIASEKRWQEALDRSPDMLNHLAEEALAEDDAGRTVDLEDSL